MSIILHYLNWHYGKSLSIILETSLNFYKFGERLFQIPWHVRTFLSPWYMDTMPYAGGFLSAKYFQALSLNMVTRLLGAVPRAAVILCGVVFECSVLILGAVCLLAWLLFPLTLISLFIIGFASIV